MSKRPVLGRGGNDVACGSCASGAVDLLGAGIGGGGGATARVGATLGGGAGGDEIGGASTGAAAGIGVCVCVRGRATPTAVAGGAEIGAGGVDGDLAGVAAIVSGPAVLAGAAAEAGRESGVFDSENIVTVMVWLCSSQAAPFTCGESSP